jgi:hypothetical protein
MRKRGAPGSFALVTSRNEHLCSQQIVEGLPPSDQLRFPILHQHLRRRKRLL